MIRVTSIAADNMQLFSAYMSRQAAAMLKGGLPLLALGALDDETACGAITGYLESKSVFRLNSLYMAPASRRRGGAALLLRALSELLGDEEQIEEVRIDYIEFGDEERGLSALLDAAGFEQEEPEMHFFGTSLSELAGSSFFSSADGQNACIVSFADMSDFLVRSVDKHFSLEGMPILDGALLGSALERELSSGLSDGRSVPAFDVITREGERLHIAFLYAEPAFSSRLPELLRASMHHAVGKYPSDTLVTMQTVNRNGEAVARRVMHGSGYRDLARSAVRYFPPREEYGL